MIYRSVDGFVIRYDRGSHEDPYVVGQERRRKNYRYIYQPSYHPDVLEAMRCLAYRSAMASRTQSRAKWRQAYKTAFDAVLEHFFGQESTR